MAAIPRRGLRSMRQGIFMAPLKAAERTAMEPFTS